MVLTVRKSLGLLYFAIGLTLVLLTGTLAFAKTPEQDHQNNLLYYEYCQQYERYVVNGRYRAECYHNYHHYNRPDRRFTQRHTESREIKIASFNMWHPGTTKSGFQDYALMAQLMNEYDVVGAQELLAVIARNLTNNNGLLEFIENGPKLLADLREQLGRNPNNDDLRIRVARLEQDLERAPNIYVAPAYLTILNELRKLDPSWALIIAPRGEGAQPQHVQELAGFYYRGSRVYPDINPHCEEFREQMRNGPGFACIPSFRQEFMGRETSHAFSRRPFMASFRSGSFTFTMLNTHVIFTTSRDEEIMRSIMQAAFGVDSVEGMGTGFTLGNYARWAEVHLTLEFMQRYRERYGRNDIMFMGDLNLESVNAFWSEALKVLPGAQVYIDEPTTVSMIKYRANGMATQGFASNYDHFVLDPSAFQNCLDQEGQLRARVDSFYEGVIGDTIRETYYIRDNPRLPHESQQLISKYEDDDEDEDREPLPPRPLTPDFTPVAGAAEIMEPFMIRIRELLSSVLMVRNNQIVPDLTRLDQRVETYRQRIFLDQLYNRTYYRLYQELLSDHHPISMSCSVDR
jgi:hypothetical protein